ncbi:hypothetical protein FX988_01184 [Paraglaciecola mesophila]|uniref:Lipoprotein n=1 Tax=Paraglaciecola mesophila TaxID=197222 RepID=A0A857JI38_9ALTE|nr:DUF6491 family protein [Paraglaciecola mesophila]QHJ10962.1 hypothetical protein FX988_01184 [Paraglaciecola mesophila]
MKHVVILVTLLLALAGCATHRLPDPERSAIIEKFITTEQLEARNTISAFDLDSWTSLSDQYLIIRTSPFRSYLVKLTMRCSDIDYSPALLVYSRIPNTLSAGFDSVFTPDNHRFKCNISRIYPLSKAQNKSLITAVSPKAEDKPLQSAQEENMNASEPSTSKDL